MTVEIQRVWAIDYGAPIEDELCRLVKVIQEQDQIARIFEPRWLAIKMLEGEQDLEAQLTRHEGGDEVLKAMQRSIDTLSPQFPGGIEIAIADKRYAFVSEVVDKSVINDRTRSSLSERVDRVVTSSWLGLPIFLIVMYLIFNLVVNVSAPYLDWIDAAMSGPITGWIYTLMMLVNAPGWLQGLVMDGVIAGVGGVLVFVPGLMGLFFFIGVLEDSGYMARAAFVMHRLMNHLGLSGKSFVALILGFGCAVPAIYATRTLDTFRDRVLTGLLVPLMSCAARLPVYVVFGIAFFGQQADVVVWSLYGTGVLVAVGSAWLLSHTVLKQPEGEKSFLLELPSYRLPSATSLWRHISQRTGGFLRNAGTVILMASMAIWLLLNVPPGESDLQKSLFGRLSTAIAPALKPAGIGNWETSGSLVTGLVAKEVVISTMSQIYTGGDAQTAPEPIGFGQGLVEIGSGFLKATGEAAKAMVEALTPFFSLAGASEGSVVDTELGLALQRAYSPLSALAFLVFVLLYIPCVATLGAIRAEFGTRWAVFSAVYQTVIAWLMAVAVFQLGSLMGFA